MQLHDENPISVALPLQVVLEIVEADPVTRGQTTRRHPTNPRCSKTGFAFKCLPSSNRAREVVVSTEDGSYVRRAE